MHREEALVTSTPRTIHRLTLSPSVAKNSKNTIRNKSKMKVKRDLMPLNSRGIPGKNHGGSNTARRRYISLVALVVIAGVVIYYLDWKTRPDPYAITPFCDADGTCHEQPHQASARTVFSAKSREQYQRWWDCFAKLNVSAEAYAKRRSKLQQDKNSEETSLPLILLGDSITESWLGMKMGVPIARAAGVPQVLSELVKAKPGRAELDPLVLAIGGDQTQHQLYRLQHGQLLPAYANDPSAIFVVMIGTNNLGAGELPGPTSQGVLAVADYILSNTKGHLVLLQILPRGDSFRLQSLCPPRCSSSGTPFTSFQPAVDKLNRAITEGIHDLTVRHSATKRFGLVKCGDPFLSKETSPENQDEVDTSLMPDLLHPNDAGHRILGKCIMDYIDGIAASDE